MRINVVVENLKQIVTATDVLYEIVKIGKENTLLSFVEKYASLNKAFASYLSQIYHQEVEFENTMKDLFEEKKDV